MRFSDKKRNIQENIDIPACKRRKIAMRQTDDAAKRQFIQLSKICSLGD